MPVGCSNDSFCTQKSPAVCSQNMRMKSAEEDEEEGKEDESVTSPLLYSCECHTISRSRLNKSKNTCTMKD